MNHRRKELIFKWPKYVGYKRPKDTKKTVKHLLTYLGHYKWAFLLIAILVFVSAGAGIMGTF